MSQQPVEASPEAWETVEPTPEETPAGWHFADARHGAWSADEEDGLSYAVEEIPVSWELADTAILSAGPIEDAEPDWTYESPDETLPMARRQKETDLATAPASPAESFSEILPSPDRSEGLAPVIPQERTPKPRLPKGRFVVLGIVAALLIGIGAGISMHQANLAKAYDQANEYYESGMFSAAAEAFAELGDYEDAAELCVKAQKWIEAEAMQDAAGKDPDAWDAAAAAYDAVTEPGAADKAQHCRNMATYYRASQKLAEEPMSLNTVKEALELFQNCGNVLDAEMKIKHCENLKSYYRGVWKLEHHPNRPAYLRQALKLLKNCGGVLDADEQIKKCENSLAYLSARKLMSNQEWAKAADAFDDLAKAGFRDSANRQAECQTRADYEEAESAFNEGRYYEAYTKFLAIGDTGYEGLPNMRERAQACIQDMPAGGVMYHNDAYTDSCQLTIDNTSNPNAYYKLYIGEELVIEAFVREDSKLTFSLPAGTYSMKKGYGDTWFGKEDLFGDEGRYYHCTFGGSEAFVLEANYAYIISAGTDGTGIGTQSTNRDDM